GRIRLRHLERRPPTKTRPCVPGRHLGREMESRGSRGNEGQSNRPHIAPHRGAAGRGGLVKIKRVEANNRKRAFEVRTFREELVYPYAKLALPPTGDDPVVDVFPDPETGREAFTYRLASGAEDTIHLDAV